MGTEKGAQAGCTVGCRAVPEDGVIRRWRAKKLENSEDPGLRVKAKR